jgi:hypothetical protein
MPNPTREDTWRITATLDGDSLGVFDKKTGGKYSANGQTYKPGAMGPAISLGGVPTADAVVISRLYDIDRDGPLRAKLLAACGRGRLVVRQQALDINGAAAGSPTVFSGLLSDVQMPDADSTSTNPAMVELTMTPDGPVTA